MAPPLEDEEYTTRHMVDYMNMPWAGVRRSSLPDILLSSVDGGSKLQKPIQSFGHPLDIPRTHMTGGYTIFATGIADPEVMAFQMPCGVNMKEVECPFDEDQAKKMRLDLVVAKNGACKESPRHTFVSGQYSVKWDLRQTVDIQTGCFHCRLVFENARTGESIKIRNLLHWAFSGTFMVFSPDVNITADDVNAAFSDGDQIRVKNDNDYGKAEEDNLALTFVHGKGLEIYDPGKTWMYDPGIIRYGVTYKSERDFNAFTVIFPVRVNPGDTYINRQYVVTGRLAEMDELASALAEETFQDVLPLGGNRASRIVELYSIDRGSFGAVIKNEGACKREDAIVRCEGSTTPQLGLVKLAAIQCGDESYVGSDLYHFSPVEEGRQSVPLRSYRCRGLNETRPQWSLLGYFKEGSCDYLQDAYYNPFYCETSAPLNEALLDDIFPPIGPTCQEQISRSGRNSKGPNSFTTKTTFDLKSTSNGRDNTRFKTPLLAEMNHIEPFDSNRTWSMRFCPGGNICSFVGRFGDAVAINDVSVPRDNSQTDSFGMHELWQWIAVNTELHDPLEGNPYMIQQAGSDMTKDIQPFFSPSIASHCSNKKHQCSFGTWAQQGTLLSEFDSSLLFYTRYTDCGSGVVEIVNVMHNTADPSSDVEYNKQHMVNWINTPWAGISGSILRDVLLSNTNGTSTLQKPLLSLMEGKKTWLHETGGYTTFAEGIKIDPEKSLFPIPCGDGRGPELPCSSYNGQLRLVVLGNNTCEPSVAHVEAWDENIHSLMLTKSAVVKTGCMDCQLVFKNERTGVTIDVVSVLHWAWNGDKMFFTPVNTLTSEDINAVFFDGDVISVWQSSNQLPVTILSPAVVPFDLPCGDDEGRGVPCPVKVKLVISKDNACAKSTIHTVKRGRYTLKLELKQTVVIRTGCSACPLLFVNERTGDSVEVTGVMHWAWLGNIIFFNTKRKTTPADINSIFFEGDEILVKHAIYGKREEDNLALTFVHGTGKELEDPKNTWMGRRGFMRSGVSLESNEQMNFFSLTLPVTVNPGDTFVKRQYIITDRLKGMDERASSLVNDTYQNIITLADPMFSRVVRLFSNDQNRFGVIVGNDVCGDQDAKVQCEGSTTPQFGKRRLFVITCGDQSYVGSNLYHFSPNRESYAVPLPLRPYVCSGQVGIKPQWSLLGYFEEGSCDYLKNAHYDSLFCTTPKTRMWVEAIVDASGFTTNIPPTVPGEDLFRFGLGAISPPTESASIADYEEISAIVKSGAAQQLAPLFLRLVSPAFFLGLILIHT